MVDVKKNKKQDNQDINYERDINQMTAQWNEMNRDQQRDRNDYRQTQKQGDQDLYSQTFKEKNNDNKLQQMREKIESLEFQLQKTNQSNDMLYKKLYETEQELQDSKALIQKIQNQNNWKANQMDELNERFGNISQTHGDFLNNARFNAQRLMIELEQRDLEIQRLKKTIDEKDDRLKVISVTQEKNLDRCLEFDKKIRELESQNQKLSVQLQTEGFENDKLILNKKVEGTFLVEVEHIRSDVKRLVQMLKQTSEFKDFADIADDDGASIRFLKDIKMKSYVDIGCNCRCVNVHCGGKGEEVIDERMLWCPEEAWKFAQEFRIRYQGELTDILIERLLFELNKIWSRREQRLVQKVKANCAHEAASLRRQLSFNPKYDEHQAKATINRLKAQLNQSYKENRELYADRVSRNPPGIKFVSETLKMSREINKTKKQANEKNKILKQKLADIESLKFIDNKEKTLFFEGAQWAFEKISTDSHALNNQFKKITSENSQHQNNLVDNTTKLIQQFNDKVTQYKKQSDKEMSQAMFESKQINRPKSGYIDTY